MTEVLGRCDETRPEWACIRDVELVEDGRLVVHWDHDVQGLQIVTGAQACPVRCRHVHVYFGVVDELDAGLAPNGATVGDYREAVSSPFGSDPNDRGYTIDDVPGAASSLCVVLADERSVVLAGTGNCTGIPGVAES